MKYSIGELNFNEFNDQSEHLKVKELFRNDPHDIQGLKYFDIKTAFIIEIYQKVND